LRSVTKLLTSTGKKKLSNTFISQIYKEVQLEIKN